jgi:hypothetical protein
MVTHLMQIGDLPCRLIVRFIAIKSFKLAIFVDFYNKITIDPRFSLNDCIKLYLLMIVVVESPINRQNLDDFDDMGRFFYKIQSVLFDSD